MWDILDIAPTKDALAIRRAYARALKALDVEKDPASFIRLREAYDAAMSDCAAPNGFHEPEEYRTIIMPAPQRAAEPATEESAPDPDEALEWEMESRMSLDALLDNYDLIEARQKFISYLAKGLIALGEQRRWVVELVKEALHNLALPQKDFADFVALLGPARVQDDEAELHRNIAARLAAHRWYDALETKAGKRAWWGKERLRFRAARLFLGRKSRIPFNRADMSALSGVLAEYKTHQPWLSARTGYLDGQQRLENLQQQLAKNLKRKDRNDRWYIIGVATFFAVDTLYVLIKKFF